MSSVSLPGIRSNACISVDFEFESQVIVFMSVYSIFIVVFIIALQLGGQFTSFWRSALAVASHS